MCAHCSPIFRALCIARYRNWLIFLRISLLKQPRHIVASVSVCPVYVLSALRAVSRCGAALYSLTKTPQLGGLGKNSTCTFEFPSAQAPYVLGQLLFDLDCAQCSPAECVHCTVIYMRSKGAGKGGKLALITSASGLGEIAKIAVQVFEHLLGRQFRAISAALSALHVDLYALLPTTAFLHVLHAEPLDSNGNIILHEADINSFNLLPANVSKIAAALKKPRSKEIEESSGEE